MPWSTSRAAATNLLRMVGLADKAHRLPRDLTQIEMRKLELARAMASEPRLLISDEAMAGLSHGEVDDILALLLKLNEQGVTIIMIEHIMRAVLAFSQRLVVLVAGRKIADGDPQEVVRQPDVVRGLPWQLASTITGLDAGYGAVRVLHDVSLRVGEGETVALLGTNGNGKSTLIKCVWAWCGRPRARIIAEIDGKRHELVGMSTEAIVDLGVGVVPEGRRLFPRLTVTENLLMGAFRRAARPQIAQQPGILLRGVPAPGGAAPAARRVHERRRAADAGAGTGADVGAAAAAGGRAVGRPGAAAGSPHDRQDQGTEGQLSD